MLINDFFTITAINYTEDVIESTITINPSHKIFEGHFPNNPITPGVIQLQMVKEILENVLNKELSLKEMGRCKFLAILNPNENPKINITIKHAAEDDVVKVTASGNSKDKTATFFKFNAKYA